MKVLVTGGAGFIGSHIVDLFHAEGHSVRVVDNMSTGDPNNVTAPVKVNLLDITDPPSELNHGGIEGLVASFKPDVICHQAAQPSLLTSVQRPIFDAQVNIFGTLHLLELAKVYGVKKFIFASTSAVYKEHEYPMSEMRVLEPTRPYGISKLAAEYYVRNSGVPYTILRYGNVFGPRQVPVGENQLIPRVLAHLIDGADFEIYGTGTNVRDFIYVGDVAYANLSAAIRDTTGTFNIGTGRTCSVFGICRMLYELVTGEIGDKKWVFGDPKPNEPPYVCLDVHKARVLLKWKAVTPLMEGLKLTVDAWTT